MKKTAAQTAMQVIEKTWWLKQRFDSKRVFDITDAKDFLAMAVSADRNKFDMEFTSNDIPELKTLLNEARSPICKLDLTLPHFQLWKGTTMLTANYPKADAFKGVSEGRLFVISRQAVGHKI